MQWNSHFKLHGKHAFLSASKGSWLRYEESQLVDAFTRALAAKKGTELHAFASEAIRLGIKLPRSSKTLNMYVNDAIGFKMTPEQVLFFSDNAFGTADAISFRKNVLRIHDLKTGVTPANMDQLMIYSAFFCLEYGFKPGEIRVELRVYQNDEVKVFEPDAIDLINVIDRVIASDKIVERMKLEAIA